MVLCYNVGGEPCATTLKPHIAKVWRELLRLNLMIPAIILIRGECEGLSLMEAKRVCEWRQRLDRFI